MSQIILSEQASAPSTPSSGKVATYVDTTGVPLLKLVDDAGGVTTELDDKLIRRAFSTGTVNTGFEADKYLVGSGITIPSGRPPVAGATYHCRFDMVKTAACTSAIVITVRFGLLGTTADAAILQFTLGVGTAAIDTGMFEIWAHFRTVGATTTAVLVGVCSVNHALAATGLTTTGTGGFGGFPLVSSGFDSTVANSILGVSFNGGTTGANFVGTNTLVEAEWRNLSV